MFNLVQIQERLKDMPMQALMAYANGQSQEVPPFLALGELNRRKRMQSSAQAEQAKAMEGAPTVKEQLEQSTGLMALQGARQRQAASRQQGLQALAPSAAPNTTTSEPVQMAAGGSVNDVIGRDYQRGGSVGQMNPQMLKKLMMLKKMQQMQKARGGLGALMGKDYAGGGIVAFAAGSKDPIGKSPAEEAEEDRRRKASMMAVRPGDVSMFDELAGLDRLRENRGDMTETGAERLARKQEAAQGKMGRWYRGEPEPADDQITEAERAQRRYTSAPVVGKDIARAEAALEAERRKIEEGRGPNAQLGIAALEGNARSGRVPGLQPATIEMLERAAGKKPAAPAGIAAATQMKGPKELTDEEQFARIKALQKMAGVKENPYEDYENRLAAIEARRKGEAMTPMDKLTEFLGAIATSKRGGNWATQGAEASQAVQKAEEGRRQLQDKQEMDMAALRMSMAKERDARARGDATAVMDEQQKQAKLRQDIAEAQSLDRYRRESVDVQRANMAANKEAEEQRRRIALVDNYIKQWMAANKGATKYMTKPEDLERDAVAAAVRRYGAPFLQSLGEAGMAMLSPDMGTGKVVDLSQWGQPRIKGQ